MPDLIQGQLNAEERRLLTSAILDAPCKPQVIVEIGTWLGGGSTLHILRALEKNGTGRLWGVEADSSIYERMIANIRSAIPEAVARFTPVFGFSQEAIPRLLAEQGSGFSVDVAFLDGGDNPGEQITEFELLAPRMPIGGQLLSHDAKLRKGRWLVPYVSLLDNWRSELHDVSEEGLFHAVKTSDSPSRASADSARRCLARLRMSPVELIGRLVPRALRPLVLRLLPAGLRRSVGQGRK